MIAFFRDQMDLAEEDFFLGIWEGGVTGLERPINSVYLEPARAARPVLEMPRTARN